MASPTQWTWVWVGSGIWWWTGKPRVVQSIESQSRTQLSDWTELNKWRNSGSVTAKYSLTGQVWNQGLRVSWDRRLDLYDLAKKFSLLHVPAPKTIFSGYVLTPLRENSTINKCKHNKGASLVAQQSRICLQCRSQGRWGFHPWVGKIPLQYSCLENAMDRGAWRATVHGVAKSWTRLKWLSKHESIKKAKHPFKLGEYIYTHFEMHFISNYMCIWTFWDISIYQYI